MAGCWPGRLLRQVEDGIGGPNVASGIRDLAETAIERHRSMARMRCDGRSSANQERRPGPGSVGYVTVHGRSGRRSMAKVTEASPPPPAALRLTRLASAAPSAREWGLPRARQSRSYGHRGSGTKRLI